MVVTTSDYAKHHVCTSLLTLVRGLHFIQSYTITSTERGRTAGWKIKSLSNDNSHSSQGHNTLKGKFCCARYLHATQKTEVLWSLYQGGYILKRLSRTWVYNLVKREAQYELWAKFLAVQCQPNSDAIQARNWNSHGLPGGESEATHLPQSSPMIYISHTIFSWQVLCRLPQLNSYLSGWFMTISCFISH